MVEDDDKDVTRVRCERVKVGMERNAGDDE